MRSLWARSRTKKGPPATAVTSPRGISEGGSADRAIASAYITWSADQPVSVGLLAALPELATALGPPDDADRRLAEGEVAFFDAQRRQAAGDPDWLAPLAAFRPRLGTDADGLHLQSRRWFRYLTTVPVIAIAAVVAMVIVSR